MLPDLPEKLSIAAVNDTFLVIIYPFQPGSSSPPGPIRLLVHCFDETLKCPGFNSTGVWDSETEYLRTQTGQHRIPYPEVEEV